MAERPTERKQILVGVFDATQQPEQSFVCVFDATG